VGGVPEPPEAAALPPTPQVVPRWMGAVAGLLAGLVAVTVGAAVSAASHRPTPVDAVGGVVIDHVPISIREFAIRTFGRGDKTALRLGIVVILSLAAAAIGVGARRHRWVAVVGVSAFTVLGILCAVSRPGSSLSAAWGPVFGGLAAVAVLLGLLHWPVPAEHPAAELAGGVRSWPTTSRAAASYERRRFLGGSIAAVGVAATATTLARGFEHDTTAAAEATVPARLPTPVGSRVVTPSGASLDAATPYVTPASAFYRIDTALDYPRVRADTWKLRIHGMVEHPVELTYAELLARPQAERAVTLTCVSNEVGGNLIGNAVWEGVLLRDLLNEARPTRGAQQVATTSVDGFTAGFPLDVGLDPHRDSLLAFGMNGRALPLPHGFPARLVVPGLYGYVSATKWITDIELTTWDGFDGYWIGEGWSKLGPIKTESRIDVPSGDVKAGRVPVAGVAWAQHRGIAKVEVQVDDGPWHVARLGDVVSRDTWRQWVWVWDATPGDHVLTVRATDAAGQTQTSAYADPAPNGATGWHQRQLRVS
jgi:DMSO/TMAO reductase YedYZ molybdopterin-dependent catalytic subunit